MDNATFHKRQDIRAAIVNAGHSLVFLPPYSPDLNPIEKKLSRDNLGEKSGNLDENRWIAERVNDCRLSHQAQAVFVS
jgi:transposase